MSVSQPRHIVPGATYLITRRTCQRAFRLRPSDLTTHIILYCLALALEKAGVILHAACFLSNHHHLVVTDPYGVLPIFLRELHRSIAKAINTSQGRWENLWSAEPCSVVRLADEQDVIDKIAYVVANPVAAGLVERPEDWPGVILWGRRVISVTRAPAYFAERGRSPAELELRVVPWNAEADAPSLRRWQDLVSGAIARLVDEAREGMRSARRRFLGRAAVLAQPITKRASSFEPRRALSPTVAAKNSIAREAMLAVQRAFRRAYHAALRVWKGGDREAVFPFGTWWMRVHHAASCEVAPASA